MTYQPEPIKGVDLTELASIPYEEKQDDEQSYWKAFRFMSMTRVGAGVLTSPHYHNDRYEILYSLVGECRIINNGVSYSFTPGDAVFFQPGDVHAVVALRDGLVEYSVFKFAPSVLSQSKASGGAYFTATVYKSFAGKDQVWFPAAQLEKTRVPALLTAIREECERVEFGYDITVCGYTLELYAQFLRLWYSEKLKDSDRSNIGIDPVALLQKCLQYTDDHLLQNPSLAQVAAHCGLSYAGFSRFFSKYMHMGFNHYVRSRKICDSACLLLDTNVPLTQIAERFGFASPSHYVASFKAYYGMTPGQYRKYYRSDQ